MSDGLTYKASGVDVDEGERFVKLISPLVKETFRKEVLTGLGGFGALFELDTGRFKRPVLISGTDGVGTKLKIAFMADRHDTVGIDLVAMCVNDILTSGAEPLFFLDYFATGRLSAETGKEVVKGIVRGCREAGCALIGGETAEMPGFYSAGEYDLSGFAVGIVEKDEIIDGSSVDTGDAVVGISSSGLHSNGFSLVRNLFFNRNKMEIDSYMEVLGRTLGEELLEPTRIYVNAFNLLRDKGIGVKAMAHITGGGISGNLPRALPAGKRALLRRGSWKEPPIFDVIRRLGNISEKEMEKTFNLGIGYIIILSADEAERAVSVLKGPIYESFIIGDIKNGEKGIEYA
ncbi:MAG TPA: phosphoribosylformylglycinamidine cyclo-ligase [Nitrospirae bacterium]|nr:phosphoribosylformylglycinamidine cyclo-ligase [Nitrospirota bacterium]HDY70407.1 phosphoribosylformylglycinamidine cyclo-ligase [Nitrospirota bacterium]